jgi:hypothetical protein
MKVREHYTRILRRSIGAWRRRPFPGPFALRILHALRDEAVACPGGTPPLRVQVDRLEPGDNPFREEFSVRFRLTGALPQWVPGSIEVTDGPIGVTEEIDSRGLPGGAPVKGDTYYFFQFRKAWGLAGSTDRFRAFIRDRLDGEGPTRVGTGAAVKRQERSRPPRKLLVAKAPIPGRRHKA